MRRVVVTGVGAVSPCGITAEASWQSVLQGKSGIARIASFDPEEFGSQIAGECRDFDPLTVVEKKRLRESARFIHIGLGASAEAVSQAGIDGFPEEVRDRIGTFIGVGFCGIEYFEETCRTLFEKGPRRITPYFIPATISNLAPGQVSMRYGFRGPSYTNTSACSSGAHAIGEAFKWIVRGGIDAAVAGGTEAAVTPMGVGGFAAMRALSKRNDAPEAASRPFDKGRDGFVIGEGAGVMVLEELEFAKRRGANILCEIVGYGASADAYHLTQPAPEGEGGQRSMRMALEDAGLSPDQVSYVNAHGTSTPTGDMLELGGIRAVFGPHATSGLSISSTKSMTGHLLGAAGGLEAVFSVLAIRDNAVPPTINLEDPEEGTEGLDLVPNVARERAVDAVLSNSFGFGGTNASLVFRRFS
ncbi:MAG: beta-ketoacyl-ACP synthase II [Myxococcales bacterium]|nr:beta-ketoacyl-ACP synthase II [Myxococcales bacterium]MCB9627034.1 beta-ketoacyl-ACP synthase II [Sandaracinaceae bacterium]